EIPATGEGYGGDMNWSARAFGRDGGILIEEGLFIIPVSAVNCDGSAFAPTATPSPSPSPAATLEQSTPTPASALDCPPGTYYSDITHKCYAYATPTATPKNGGNDGNELNCPQYTSDSACKAAGCTFNYTTKSCQ
ncbi:MAG TPA: hypothetical protein VFI68_13240, partial [Anaerolineales bacterium]|nr:hypothetical protein [Anaerolineales bacterium]